MTSYFTVPLRPTWAAVSLLFVTSCAAVADSTPVQSVGWHPAAEAAPPELTAFVRNTEIDPSWMGDPQRMSVSVIGEGESILYLVNPKIAPPKQSISLNPSLSPLCGTGGCRYLGYVRRSGSYEKVFDVQLQDALPPDTPAFQVELGTAELPCLLATEFPRPYRSLSVHRYCFSGTKYVLRETTFKSPTSP